MHDDHIKMRDIIRLIVTIIMIIMMMATTIITQ